MPTQYHWDACKETASYYAAQNLAFQLKEIAKKNRLDPNGIKVFSKQQTHNFGSCATAQVRWTEGPSGWVDGIDLYSKVGVCVEVEDDYTISFYDI